MASPQRFQINRPSVIHEILDDELVIVNLKSGSYYSLDRVGAEVWRELDGGATTEAVTAAVKRQFEGDAAAIDRAIADLLAEFQREDLIVPATTAAPEQGGAAPRGAANGKAPFAPPVLHKYTDMQDLLLLDPIHEVDETGWPTRKA
jgi:hypothetical protein